MGKASATVNRLGVMEFQENVRARQTVLVTLMEMADLAPSCTRLARWKESTTKETKKQQ